MPEKIFIMPLMHRIITSAGKRKRSSLCPPSVLSSKFPPF